VNSIVDAERMFGKNSEDFLENVQTKKRRESGKGFLNTHCSYCCFNLIHFKYFIVLEVLQMNQGLLATIIVIVMLSIAAISTPSKALAQNMSGRIRESKVTSRTKYGE
jgi:hypothetical protein